MVTLMEIFSVVTDSKTFRAERSEVKGSKVNVTRAQWNFEWAAHCFTHFATAQPRGGGGSRFGPQNSWAKILFVTEDTDGPLNVQDTLWARGLVDAYANANAFVALRIVLCITATVSSAETFILAEDHQKLFALHNDSITSAWLGNTMHRNWYF